MIDHSGEILKSGVKILEKTSRINKHGSFLYRHECHCGNKFEQSYDKRTKSCGCESDNGVDHSGEVLESGVRVLERLAKTNKFKVRYYKMECHCGEIFETPFRKNVKSCGCSRLEDRSGEILKSGVNVLEKTNNKDIRGNYYYKMKCQCGNIFERVYHVKIKSCGCETRSAFTGLNYDHSGEVLESGVEVICKTTRTNKYSMFYYKMKCPVCGNYFEAIYKSSIKSCGCLFKKLNKHKIVIARELNLKFGTNIGNIQNQRLYKNNSTGIRGVSYDPRTNKFSAIITFQGHSKRIGYYDTLEEAGMERKKGEVVVNDFLEWYTSLSEEEKAVEAERHKSDEKYYFNLCKTRLNQALKKVKV